MKKDQPFSLGSRLKSFTHAVRGLLDILRTEHNARVHAVISVLVCAAALWLRLDAPRLALVMLSIVAVWMAEAFNTVFEILANILSPEYSPYIRRAKDVGAAAVLISAAGAAMVGLLLLGPPLLQKIS